MIFKSQSSLIILLEVANDGTKIKSPTAETSAGCSFEHIALIAYNNGKPSIFILLINLSITRNSILRDEL